MIAALSRAREWLTLLAVAGVAAWLYVELQHARTERDRVQHAAELVCAASGKGFPGSIVRQASTGGKPVDVAYPDGQLCRRQVAALVAFRADAERATAQLLAKALKDAADRQLTDNLAARAAAEAARSAAIRMEAADADAERRNVVDREWFAAVNGVAGLRATQR